MSTQSDSPFPPQARSDVNTVWGALTMEVLARLGVGQVVVSPGSRSAPLALAAARHPKLEAIPVLDERSAGFFALGLAKRARRPVALVCTSGTAAVNFFPAVVEASMSGTPLLVLTADRPPELRDCAAGQAIDQLKLYGGFVRQFTEMALPEASRAMLDYLRQTLVHAVDRACRIDPGPVHLNFPFREPLVPEADAEPVIGAEVMEACAAVSPGGASPVAAGAGFDPVALEALARHRRGLIAVGAVNPVDPQGFSRAVTLLARKLGWPVLADVLNPLREFPGDGDGPVCRYDAILRDPGRARELTPSAVLQVGPPPTSKVLRQWLGGLDAETFLLSDRPGNTDPLHRRAVPLRGGPAALAAALPRAVADDGWAEGWSAAEAGRAAAFDAALAPMTDLFEGKAAWLLARTLPEGTPVFLAGSMPVRYAELFWGPAGRSRPVFSNRGANGIDGTLGTAMGVAQGGPPAVLLTGDLAFLHDSNALLALSRLRGSLTVVLVNNGGGGIFEFLPVARAKDAFEDFFATPQAVDIEALVRAHGAAYERIEDWDTFEARVRRLPEAGLRVLELRTDRKADRATLGGMLG